MAIEREYLELGRNIYLIRRLRNINQKTLSNRVGMSRGSVANVELGNQRLPLHLIPVFAEALGVPVRDLMRGIFK